MPTTAHIAPHYNRYGRNGYDIFCVGFEVLFFATMRLAKKWAKGHNVDLIK